MKKAAFGLALLLGGAAFAQTSDPAPPPMKATAPHPRLGDGSRSRRHRRRDGERHDRRRAAGHPAGNADPERDARGIAVISAPAVPPAGWNGVPASAMGGPDLDPATGEAAAESYPACTASVTDKCLQTYERGRR